MAETNYIASIKELLDDLRRITVQAMAETGIKKSSDLSKSVKFSFTKDGIQMEVAEYYGWVSDGHRIVRRARVKRVPLDVLIQWIKSKNILPRNQKTGRFITVNQMAFAVQTAIWKRGIQRKTPTIGRGFAQTVADNVADYTAEELANELAMQIADDIVNELKN